MVLKQEEQVEIKIQLDCYQLEDIYSFHIVVIIITEDLYSNIQGITAVGSRKEFQMKLSLDTGVIMD